MLNLLPPYTLGVERNIPQEEALERLIALIKANGDWIEE